MHVTLDPNILDWPEQPHRLELIAETEAERELIERIEREYITTNYGRGHHVGVELTPVKEAK